MNKSKNASLLASWIIAMVGPLLMLLSTALPYASAKDSEQAAVASRVLGEELLNPSLLGFTKIYLGHAGQEVTKEQAYITAAVFAAIVVFSVLALLFAVLKKPIAALVFDVLALLAFLLQNFDFSDRGIVPSDNYAWGIGYYSFFVAFVVALVGAIWLLVAKRQNRHSHQH